MTADLSAQSIFRARRNLAGKVRRTQLTHSPSLSALVRVPVYLKLESRQTTGSFKLRGATNAIAHLDARERGRGVVTASTGNHGRAMAHAARANGMRAVVCLSRLVPANKVDAIRALGAEVRVVGASQDEAQLEVQRLVEQEQLVMLPAFDHPHVIAGQATIGLEILEQLPEVQTVLVPLSGGGLLAGVALALKTANPAIGVVGVSMEQGCAMHTSLKADRPVLVQEVESLADSLGGGIGLGNRYTFAIARQFSDHTLLVDEGWIASAIRHAYWQEQEIVEGAGAVGIAALLAGRVDVAHRPGPVVLIVSGRNIDMALHQQLMATPAVTR